MFQERISTDQLRLRVDNLLPQVRQRRKGCNGTFLDGSTSYRLRQKWAVVDGVVALQDYGAQSANILSNSPAHKKIEVPSSDICCCNANCLQSGQVARKNVTLHLPEQ